MRNFAVLGVMILGLSMSSAHAAPPVYSSSAPQISDVPMTTGTPYTFWGAYFVGVPGLVPTDVVQCHAQAEVTNKDTYNVQIDRAIGVSPSGSWYPGYSQPGYSPQIVTLNPLYGENVTPDMHHMTIDTWGTDTGRTGTMYYSLLLEAASTSATPGDYADFNGNGGIWCTVFH